MIPAERSQQLVCPHSLSWKLKLVENPLQAHYDVIITLKFKNRLSEVTQHKQRLKKAVNVACSPFIDQAVV
jgi:hypothetical protein